MRILALHLPQFHEVEENNRWWGQGFTEWTSVRGAKPLFKGHAQPQQPADDRYYDLTDPEALAWQADVSREGGIDGLVFFHYWYTGKKMLERPVELWRDTPEINQNYALCWANHPWTRSWDGKEHDVLQAQTYGGVEDWDEHIAYLLTFFQDERYIRHDNRPMLVLYNASAIPNVDEMLAHWEKKVQEVGFSGLYVVEYIGTKNPVPAAKASRAVYEDEPINSLRFQTSALHKAIRVVRKKMNWIDFQNYDKVWSAILRKRRTYDGRAIIQGAFVAWDNSPRRGARGPMIIKGASPKKFQRYLTELLKLRRQDVSHDFLLINAWNEWGEGAVLEPSVADGRGYLDAVKTARAATIDAKR